MRTTTIAAAAALAVTSFAVAGTTVDVTLADVASWDLEGDSSNTVLTVDLGAALGTPGDDVIVNGIGWDVTIETVGASWLSEANVGFEFEGDGINDLFLAPSGTGAPGIESLSSGGIVPVADITAVGGVVTLEFFESFDDVSDDIDAFWNGTISISVVPAPGVLALLGVAGLTGTRRRRA